VTYRERIALPPTAVVTIRLEDVSPADAPSVLIAEQVIHTEGRQAPFEFALAYDASRILPSHTYAVQVQIEDGGKLLFISDTMNPVITRDAPNRADIVVHGV
jgi:putative lipoprotein